MQAKRLAVLVVLVVLAVVSAARPPAKMSARLPGGKPRAKAKRRPKSAPLQAKSAKAAAADAENVPDKSKSAAGAGNVAAMFGGTAAVLGAAYVLVPLAVDSASQLRLRLRSRTWSWKKPSLALFNKKKPSAEKRGDEKGNNSDKETTSAATAPASAAPSVKKATKPVPPPVVATPKATSAPAAASSAAMVDPALDGLAILRAGGNDAFAAGTGASDGAKTYTVLFFDTDAMLSADEDSQARAEYFALMASLSSPAATAAAAAAAGEGATAVPAAEAVPMQAVYVPGHKTAHLMQSSERPANTEHWAYIKDTAAGAAAATALRSKYGVAAEELRVIVLGPDGSVVTENALDLLRLEPNAMPWAPRPLLQLVTEGGALLLAGTANVGESGSGDPVNGNEKGSANISTTVEAAAALTGKHTLVYFSASWCAPCKAFTPKLVAAYEASRHAAAANGEQPASEVVLVSLDKDEEAFDAYRAGMPWLAVPFNDRRRAWLQLGLAVKSIPALLVLDEQGRLVDASGVTKLSSGEYDLDGLCEGPQTSSAATATTTTTAGSGGGDGAIVEVMQRHPVCVALCEGCSEEEKARVRAAMAAHKVAAATGAPLQVPRSSREDVAYAVIDDVGSKLGGVIRSLCGLGEGQGQDERKEEGEGKHAQLLLLDLASEHCALLTGARAGVDEAGVAAFVADYKAFRLPLRKLHVPDQDQQL